MKKQTNTKANETKTTEKPKAAKKTLKILQDGEILAVNGGGVVVENQY